MLTRRSLLTGLAGLTALGAGTGIAACARKDPQDTVSSPDLTPQTYPYGPEPIQAADLYLPEAQARGVVVTIHGGFWSSVYDRSLEVPVARDLVAAGYAVWNLDYRSLGNGGGWPETFDDVAAGLDALVPACAEHGLPVDRVALVGHSAGGHLALWGAGRHRLPDGAPGSVGRGTARALRPAAVVSQAGVNDLVAAHREHLGGDAVAALMEVDAAADLASDPRIAAASPIELVPTSVPTLVVTGDLDDTVPPSQSTAYAEGARAAGDDVELVVVSGEGHFEHLDPASQVWARTRSWLDDRVG